MNRHYVVACLLLLLALSTSPSASATPIQIVVQGDVDFSVFNGSITGPANGSTINVSLQVESDLGQLVPAGTPFYPGFVLDSNFYLFSGAAISNFITNVGSVSFAQSDLLTQTVSQGEFQIGLYGDNLSGATHAFLIANNGINNLYFGGLSCTSFSEVCSFISEGTLAGDAVGAGIRNIQTTATAIQVPEPGTLVLYLLGLFGTIVVATTRNRKRA